MNSNGLITRYVRFHPRGGGEERPGILEGDRVHELRGDIFDGADGSQMAFWTCRETASSAAQVHDYDEYMLVVQGC